MNTYQYILDKYKINVGSSYIIDIPNVGRDDLAKLFGELNFKVGAEIGVERGAYSEIICKANPAVKLFCIDPWSPDAYEVGNNGVHEGPTFFNANCAEAVARLAPYNAVIIRKGSMEALPAFADNSLDFVYIDANHDFVNFTNDLHYWIKKVRPGGIISGHDYAIFSYKKFNHVKRALDAYARCYRMIPFFVLGSLEYVEGQTRDKYRSWFWVKT